MADGAPANDPPNHQNPAPMMAQPAPAPAQLANDPSRTTRNPMNVPQNEANSKNELYFTIMVPNMGGPNFNAGILQGVADIIQSVGNAVSSIVAQAKNNTVFF